MVKSPNPRILRFDPSFSKEEEIWMVRNAGGLKPVEIRRARTRLTGAPVGPRRARTRPMGAPIGRGQPDGHFAGKNLDGEFPV